MVKYHMPLISFISISNSKMQQRGEKLKGNFL